MFNLVRLVYVMIFWFVFFFNQQIRIRNETSCYFVVYLLELHVLTLNFSKSLLRVGQMTKYIVYSGHNLRKSQTEKKATCMVIRFLRKIQKMQLATCSIVEQFSLESQKQLAVQYYTVYLVFVLDIQLKTAQLEFYGKLTFVHFLNNFREMTLPWQ